VAFLHKRKDISMTTNMSGPQRLYLMQVATMSTGSGSRTIPIPCYLIQTGDGKNILIDSGWSIHVSEVKEDAAGRSLKITHTKNVVEQLALLGIQPSDIDLLICTHYDIDHAGNIEAFPDTQLVVQRLQHEVATSGHPRFTPTRTQWDLPDSRLQLVDGDTELLPGLELIETSGHVPGHQSILVYLPQSGPVLLAVDAVPMQVFFTADRDVSPVDNDGPMTIASTRKLLDLVEKKHISQVIFGHDTPQWATLKQLPEFFA
jgi:N-acyl homoserine lactone hydrolase